MPDHGQQALCWGKNFHLFLLHDKGFVVLCRNCAYNNESIPRCELIHNPWKNFLEFKLFEALRANQLAVGNAVSLASIESYTACVWHSLKIPKIKSKICTNL